MSKQWITEWTFLVVLAVGSLRTTKSLEAVDCEKLDNKTCILVTQCVSALNLIKTAKYGPLRRMFCGYELRGPKVCCPIDSPIVFTNDTETATSRVKTTPMTTTMATTTETVNQYGLPSRQVCGLNKSGQDRIVGGDIASLEEFPWLVRIKSKPENSDKPASFNCGGSLISDRYVLTAAHCIQNRAELSVRLGEWDTETVTDCQDGACSDPPVDIDVANAVIHPLFDRRLLKNDIALLSLKEAANFTDFVRPVCLPLTEYPTSQDYVVGTSFWVAGWGITEYGSVSVIKRKIALDTMPLDVCIERMPQVKEVDPNKILCAGGKIGMDTCNGDSGGSLVKEIADGGYVNWYLYGITSFGSRLCGTTDKPSVYTRVTSYITWIKETLLRDDFH